MTAPDLTAFALKLIFGTLAFLLIGFLGSSHDRRVAGAMLTFPVLNGIGLLTSPDKDPVAVTDAMMPVIVLNALLCFGFIVTFRWAKRHVGAGDTVLSYGVGLAGGLIWCLVTGLLAPWLAPLLPISFWIAALYLFATAIATVLLWSSSPPRTVARADAAVPFTAFWWARRWRAA